jgi:hypothetical protein
VPGDSAASTSNLPDPDETFKLRAAMPMRDPGYPDGSGDQRKSGLTDLQNDPNEGWPENEQER